MKLEKVKEAKRLVGRVEMLHECIDKVSKGSLSNMSFTYSLDRPYKVTKKQMISQLEMTNAEAKEFEQKIDDIRLTFLMYLEEKHSKAVKEFKSYCKAAGNS